MADARLADLQRLGAELAGSYRVGRQVRWHLRWPTATRRAVAHGLALTPRAMCGQPLLGAQEQLADTPTDPVHVCSACHEHAWAHRRNHPR